MKDLLFFNIIILRREFCTHCSGCTKHCRASVKRSFGGYDKLSELADLQNVLKERNCAPNEGEQKV